jgi:1-acyl-sn-glycerol-3-phosphate acyltransferase
MERRILIFLRKKPFRPDPFRFRPPKITLWLYGYFYLLNLYLLHPKFQLTRLNISPQDFQRFKASHSPGKSTLMLLNHVNFMDPHIMVELTVHAGMPAQWLAGIEPFDSGNGIFGWHIQRMGAFSIDRGVLDRRSLETAQRILETGETPLVIYPEGEAAYNNKVLQSFYPGATLFALNAAEKFQADPKHPVTILPIGVTYRFTGSPEPILKATISALLSEVRQAALSEGAPVINVVLDEDAALWSRIKHLIQVSLAYLEGHYRQFPDQMQTSLPQRLEALRDCLLKSLCKEHQPNSAIEALTLDELMLLKNRLRSIIARKRHAPPLGELEAAVTQTQQLQKALEEDRFNSKATKTLTALEQTWIGLSEPDKSPEKRLRVLSKHLNQQKPYALIRHDAQASDLVRWDRQINETRRVKMLTLLIGDLEREDTTPEGIDETLVKLEILLFSRFAYRGPKSVMIRVGKPLDVKQWLSEAGGCPKKELQERLTSHLQETIAGLLTFPVNGKLDSPQRISVS